MLIIIPEQTILTFDYGIPIIPGEPKGGIIYLNYSKICDSYDILTPDQQKSIPKELPVANQSSVQMKLTNHSTDEESITQHLRTPLSFAYTLKQKTTVNIDLVVSGKRDDPTVIIKPKIKYYGNDSEDNIELYVGKIDLTNYNKTRKLDEIDDNLKYIDVYPRGKFVKEIEDKPIQSDRENKNHVVLYIVVVYGKSGSIYYNKIKYEQNDINIASSEIFLIILSVLLIAATGIIIWRIIFNRKKMSDKIENNVKNENLDKLLYE